MRRSTHHCNRLLHILLNVALPTPDCVDIGAMGIPMGRLCAVDDEGAMTDGEPCGRISGRLTGGANTLNGGAITVGAVSSSVLTTSANRSQSLHRQCLHTINHQNPKLELIRTASESTDSSGGGSVSRNRIQPG